MEEEKGNQLQVDEADENVVKQRLEFIGPNSGFKGSNTEFKRPNLGFKGPNSEFKAPHSEYKGPNSEFKGPHSEFKGPNLEFKGPNSELEGANSDFKAPNSEFKTPNLEFKRSLSEFKAPNSEFNGPRLEFKAPRLDFNKVPPRLDLKSPRLDLTPKIQRSSNSTISDSPIPDFKSRFAFGTEEYLHSHNDRPLIGEESPSLQRSSSFLSQKARDADNINFYRPAPAFGRSRRMSRSLPELRECQFVSVLPDLEEEESEVTEYEDQEVVYEGKPTVVPWHRKLDFVLCSVCQSLGLSNFWRFPYYCYSNGGGTFLLAYFILLIVCAVPLLCMELAVGQLTKAGPISAFGQLCPLMKGIGVSSMMLSFWVTAYYSVLVSWTLFYIFNSFYATPRWSHCTNTWNSPNCKELGDYDNQKMVNPEEIAFLDNATQSFANTNGSSAIDYMSLLNASRSSMVENGERQNFTPPAVEFVQLKMLESGKGIEDAKELRFELLAAVMFVWVLTYFALRKKDFFRRTTIYILTIASHLLLFSVFLRTVALDGAKNGLHYLFKPEWDKFANSRLWLYALAQAFYSLGVVLGPTIVMGSAQKSHNNLLRDSIVLTVVTVLTVIMVGCITFGTLGHLALKHNKPIEKVLGDDPSSVFVLYSVVIATMPVPSCWGVIFFLVFLCLGLDSQIKLMATLVSALKEAYTYYIKQRFHGHSVFLAAICGVCFCATIPYLTQSGIYFLQLIDHYVAVVAMVVVAMFEVCTLAWLYGASNLTTAIQQMTRKVPSWYFKLSWMVFCPCGVLAVLGYSAFQMRGDFVRPGYTYPQWAHITGWVAFALTLCWIPFLAIGAYRRAPKSHLFSRLTYAMQANFQTQSNSTWNTKPVLIFNGSTANDSEYPDCKIPEFPSSPNSVSSYVMERHGLARQNLESHF